MSGKYSFNVIFNRFCRIVKTLQTLRLGKFTGALRGLHLAAFTLVEMLMALLIVSVILSASLPVISMRVKSQAVGYSKYSSVPIGMIAMWKVDGALPDNTWLEANGQVIPNGIEYEECRRIFGARLPDLRGADNEFYDSLNSYLSKDIKEYLQSAIKPIPKDVIAIWGTNAAIPEGWSEATEYRGVFLRGYGSLTHTQNNGSTIGNTATTHSSGGVGAVQGDAFRCMTGAFDLDIVSNYWYQNSHLNANAYDPTGILTGHFVGENAGIVTGPYTNYINNTVIRLDSSRSIPTSNEIRPINKAVRYIKYSNSPAMPDMPEAPKYTQKFRYIVKVKN